MIQKFLTGSLNYWDLFANRFACSYGSGQSHWAKSLKSHVPWKCQLFCCLAIYSTCEMKKTWLCQAQTGTCKLQLNHSIHYAWFHFELINTHTFWWAMLWSFEPQLNILVPDLRMTLLPWYHKCYSVRSVKSWELGVSGVKSHCLLFMLLFDWPFATTFTSVYVRVVTHCCISYVFFCVWQAADYRSALCWLQVVVIRHCINSK